MSRTRLPLGPRPGVWTAVLASLVLLAATVSVAAAQQFTNSDGPITIPDSGPASLYPSVITVSGVAGTITDLNVTLTALSHSCSNDLDVLLVAPDGTNAIFMSDAGFCNNSAPALTLILDDQAGTPLPNPTTQVLTSGSFQPANYPFGCGAQSQADDPFPPSAPAPSGAVALSTFNGLNPVGQWKLFIVDDCGGDFGRLTSWTLSFTGPVTLTPTATATPTSTATSTPTPPRRSPTPPTPGSTTATATSTLSPTVSQTPTASLTRTTTPTRTVTPTPTQTPTATVSPSTTTTRTSTLSATVTSTPSVSATPTTSRTVTSTSKGTASPTLTATTVFRRTTPTPDRVPGPG